MSIASSHAIYPLISIDLVARQEDSPTAGHRLVATRTDSPARTAPHRTAPYRTSLHFTALTLYVADPGLPCPPHRTAPHRVASHRPATQPTASTAVHLSSANHPVASLPCLCCCHLAVSATIAVAVAISCAFHRVIRSRVPVFPCSFVGPDCRACCPSLDPVPSACRIRPSPSNSPVPSRLKRLLMPGNICYHALFRITDVCHLHHPLPSRGIEPYPPTLRSSTRRHPPASPR